MNNHSALLQNLLETSFLNTVVPTPGIISVTCETLFGRGTTSVVREQTEDGFMLDITAKGETSAIWFKTEPSPQTKGNIRIVAIEV